MDYMFPFFCKALRDEVGSALQKKLSLYIYDSICGCFQVDIFCNFLHFLCFITVIT